MTIIRLEFRRNFSAVELFGIGFSIIGIVPSLACVSSSHGSLASRLELGTDNDLCDIGPQQVCSCVFDPVWWGVGYDLGRAYFLHLLHLLSFISQT